MLSPSRVHGPECPSDLTLDRLAADELAPEACARLHAHLGACGRCDAHVRRREAEARAFLASPESAATLARLLASRASEPPRSLQREQPGGALGPRHAWAAVAVAALALLALRAPHTRVETVRTKGSTDLTLGYWVKRGERVVRGTPDAPVAPHDQLRFTVRAEEPGHLTLLSRDAHGAVSVYFPAPGASAWVDGSRAEHALDGAVELDDVLGEERIVGLLCDAAPALEPLRRALERAPTLEAPPGCRKSELAIVKERASR